MILMRLLIASRHRFTACGTPAAPGTPSFRPRLRCRPAAVHGLPEVERGHALRQGAGPDQCVVIPNGAEFDPDADFPDGNLFREHARVDPDAPLVLFMGRLHRVKGLDLLVDAFARVRADVPAAQLAIAGPDEGERAAIEARARRLGIADAVPLPGRRAGASPPSPFRAPAVFSLPSYSQGRPQARSHA